MSTPEPLLPPSFTGGTGRSGTTIVANLLDRHPDIGRTRPWEARFLTDRSGLCDLVSGRAGHAPARLLHGLRTGGVAAFEHRLRGHWFRRTAGNAKVVGLHQGIDEETLEAALVGFRRRLREDAPAAAVRLTHELLDPPVRARGKPRWIETTPANAMRADALLRIFPDLRLVHLVRDGRDVAASVAERYWGPDDIDQALRWWEDRMRRAGTALARVPAHQVLTLQLEDLVLRRREETLHRLLDFLGLRPAEEFLGYCAAKLSPERAHLRRWETALEGPARTAFDERYQSALERLVAAGAPVPS